MREPVLVFPCRTDMNQQNSSTTEEAMVLTPPLTTSPSSSPSSHSSTISIEDKETKDEKKKAMMIEQEGIDMDSTHTDYGNIQYELLLEQRQRQRPRGGSMSVLFEQQQRLRQQQQQQQPEILQPSSNHTPIIKNHVVELAAVALTSLRTSTSPVPPEPQMVNPIHHQQRRRSMSVNDAALGTSSVSSNSVETVIRKAKKAASSLVILLHAQNCLNNTTCPVSGCREAKILQIHLKVCEARNDSGRACPTNQNGCQQARKLLAHYRQCKSTRVRRVAGQASSSATSLSSSPNASTLSSSSPQCLVCSLVARQAKSMLETGYNNTSSNASTSGNLSSSLSSLNSMKKISPKSAINGRTSTKYTSAGNGTSSMGLISLHVPVMTTTSSTTIVAPNVVSNNNPHDATTMPPPPPRFRQGGVSSLPSSPHKDVSQLSLLSLTAAQKDPIALPTQLDTDDDMQIDGEEGGNQPTIKPILQRRRSNSHSSFLTPSTILPYDDNNFLQANGDQRYIDDEDVQEQNLMQQRRNRSISIGGITPKLTKSSSINSLRWNSCETIVEQQDDENEGMVVASESVPLTSGMLAEGVDRKSCSSDYHQVSVLPDVPVTEPSFSSSST